MMEHQSVLVAESLTQLAIREDGVYVDGTFGRGGHSQKILANLGESGLLIALDRDSDAIDSDMANSLRKDKRFTLLHNCISRLESEIVSQGLLGRVDGILFDLGVSSPQLDNAQRGFSFMQNGPLDMRMDSNAELTAAKWLANVEEKELIRVLFEYGEERFARRIAHAIIHSRQEKPLRTTHELASLIEQAVPKREKFKHPATRSFQAIRIEINKELDELTAALNQSLRVLKQGGRLVVISFHSLEDRIVKQFIRAESGAKNDPGKLPVKEKDIERGMLMKKGHPIKPSLSEIMMNPRARSAIMRVAERV